MNDNLNEPTVTERASYEPPSIVEDLPLESYSLACDKATGCEDSGGIATS